MVALTDAQATVGANDEAYPSVRVGDEGDSFCAVPSSSGLLPHRVRTSSEASPSKYTPSAPEGDYAKTFPLALGRVRVTAGRSGARIASVVSPEPVVASPVVQDLQYVAASNRE